MGKNTCLQMELAMAKETFTLKFGLCITTQQPAYDQIKLGLGLEQVRAPNQFLSLEFRDVRNRCPDERV